MKYWAILHILLKKDKSENNKISFISDEEIKLEEEGLINYFIIIMDIINN